MKDPDSGSPFEKPMPGASLSLTANRSTSGTGLLWASLPLVGDAVAADVPGLLRVFDAANVGRHLWCAGTGTFAKFNSPTVANGKVYLGTFDGRLNVYGDGAHAGPQFPGEKYEIKSRPVAGNGNLFFQGKDDKLTRVNINNPSDADEWFGGYKAKSTPFVSEGHLYFQGGGGGKAEDRLVRVSITQPNQDNHIFDNLKMKSSPFVSGGFVYFQSTDSDKLMRVSLNNPGNPVNLGGYKTKSPPFVSGNFVYFQAGGNADDRLMKVNIASPNGPNNNLGGFKTKSSPFVFKGYVYFQGTDDRLWKVDINNPNGLNGSDNLNGIRTKSSPWVVAGPAGSTFPDYIFFQGPDIQNMNNALWRVGTDGKGLTTPGTGGKGLTTPTCNNLTNSTPFVEGDRVFFQDVNNKLVMAWAYE
jgi:hypothetical protein